MNLLVDLSSLIILISSISVVLQFEKITNVLKIGNMPQRVP